AGWPVTDLSPRWVLPIPEGPLRLRRRSAVCPAPTTGRLAPTCPATNDQIDTPTDRFVADLTSAHPRPRPRGSSASNARLTTSLIGQSFRCSVCPDPLNQA